MVVFQVACVVNDIGVDSSMAVFLVAFVVFLGLGLSIALLRWNEMRYRKIALSPGTMG